MRTIEEISDQIIKLKPGDSFEVQESGERHWALLAARVLRIPITSRMTADSVWSIIRMEKPRAKPVPAGK